MRGRGAMLSDRTREASYGARADRSSKAYRLAPAPGRFLQVDPVGYEDQVNIYAYVGNDPVNRADPTGMCDPSSDPDCIHDPATAPKAPDLPTTETTEEQDTIVVTALRGRSQETRGKDVGENDELPIVVINGQPRRLQIGRDYRVEELICRTGSAEYEVTKTTISGDSYDGAQAGGHLHRANRDPGPGIDDGHSVARRGVVQYVGWGRGQSFGAGKVEYRSGYGFTYRGLTENQPSSADVRQTLARMNDGGGRGTSSRGITCLQNR